MMNQQPILPTPLEQIRTLAQYFDLPIKENINKKALDDKVYDKNIRMELMRSIIAEVWHEPLKAILPTTLATNMHNILLNYFDNYLKNIVGQISFDCLSRDELMPILATYYFPASAYIFLVKAIPSEYQFSDIRQLFIYENKSVNVVLNWLNDSPVWQKYLSQLETKEDKDKIERWRRGEYLPSYQAIKLLSQDKENYSQLSLIEDSQWDKITLWLLVARVLDEVRKLENAKHIFNSLNMMYHIHLELGLNAVIVSLDKKIHQSITEIRFKQANNLAESLKLFAELKFNLLSLNSEKTEDMKHKSYNELMIARSIAEPNGRIAYEGQHWDWLEARWHLFSGDLEKSIEYYKKAFENSLYCMGDNLKSLIREALVATAYFEKQYKVSQRKFLAHLKNASIVFSYELPSIDKKSKKINHKDTVYDWEVEMWASTFHYIFTSKAYFPNVVYPHLNMLKNHLIFQKNIDKIQPDYKNPNKLIPRTGELGSRKIPQLQFFITWHNPSQGQDNFEIIKKLLECGADVNQLSTSNESALLLALDTLDLEDMGFTTQDRRLFDLIVQYHHTPETVNAKTLKKEKYPLRQAVLTGRPDIVKKVLDMGAIVDDTNVLNITPLYQTLTLLGQLQMGEKGLAQVLASPKNFNQKELEFLRRENSANVVLNDGLTFYSSANQPQYNSEESAFFDALIKASARKFFNNLNTYSSISKIEEIACILLDYGADPNYSHDIETLSGYTPLMLAIETNNPTVFEKMIEKGGDTKLCYYDKELGRVDCQEIKQYWKSDKINL